MVMGDERTGAVAGVMKTLAAARINVTALQAVCAGAGRFGIILWTSPTAIARAGRLLGAA